MPIHPDSGSLPPLYSSTRDALHLVAARVLGAARYLAVGRMGLIVTAGGFGTPEFDARQLLVVDGELSDGRRRHPFSTLGDACAFAWVDPQEPLHPALSLPGAPGDDLPVDTQAATILAEWFALGQSLLEELAAAGTPDEAVSSIQLWPEHFDLALEMGPPGSRANYGASPGDGAGGEPYFYVGPHEARNGPFWNAPFGAVLTRAEVRGGASPIDFLQQGRRLLSAVGPDRDDVPPPGE